MTEQAQVKISRFAVASLVLGLLYLPLIPAVLAVILGIVAKRHIHRSEGRYLGKGLAVAGIILGVIQGIYWVFLLFSGGAVFTVGLDEVAVITRFGKIQKTVPPGLNFKMPFIEKVIKFPTRIREWHSKTFECETADGQRVTIRGKVRYRICDPVRYLQTLGQPPPDESSAPRQLGELFYPAIMNEARGLPLREFVSSVRSRSLQKTFHDNFNKKLKAFGICMYETVEPYEVLETSLE